MRAFACVLLFFFSFTSCNNVHIKFICAMSVCFFALVPFLFFLLFCFASCIFHKICTLMAVVVVMVVVVKVAQLPTKQQCDLGYFGGSPTLCRTQVNVINLILTARENLLAGTKSIFPYSSRLLLFLFLLLSPPTGNEN